jgi:hypothetical protein
MPTYKITREQGIEMYLKMKNGGRKCLLRHEYGVSDFTLQQIENCQGRWAFLKTI